MEETLEMLTKQLKAAIEALEEITMASCLENAQDIAYEALHTIEELS